MFCPQRYILYNAELLGKKQKKKKAAFFQGKGSDIGVWLWQEFSK